MIKKIKNGLNKRKVKIFSLFLVCAVLAWFVSKLSETYVSTATFKLAYQNAPENLFFTNASKHEVDVSIKASGFQFVGFSFNKRKVAVDLNQLNKIDERYYIPESIYEAQIKERLPSSVEFVGLNQTDTLFLELYKLYTKSVPIISQLKIDLAQNHMLQEDVVLEPSQVVLSGSKEEIDAVSSIKTEVEELSGVSSNFNKKISLILPEELKNVKFSNKSVSVSGRVFKFSEKVIELPVEVINLPKDLEIKTFPNKVLVLCKASIAALKDLKQTDFRLVADYNTVKNENRNTMILELIKQPKQVYGIRLKTTEVDFVVKRK